MSDPLVPAAGAVLSADIAVPEHEREVRFYSGVLSTGENPLWREDLMNNLGMPIIGLGARSPEYAQLPLQWMPHIQVVDVAASAERGLDLGGSELMHGKDDDGKSQWAVLLDPDGAAFGIIPVVSTAAVPSTGGASRDAGARVGRISGLDLAVSDASAAREFYRQVVGWSAQDVEMENASGRYVDYSLFAGDGAPAARVCHSRGANVGLPPIWMISLPVGDLAESLRRAREGGGEITKATRGPDGKFAYAVVQDPVGACVALVPG